jgi:thiol-disulfide isomerase/thioredoxin
MKAFFSPDAEMRQSPAINTTITGNPHSVKSKSFTLHLGRLKRFRWIPVFFIGIFLLAGCRGTDSAGNGMFAPIPAGSVSIYLFWGNGCPHCAQAKPFLESLAQKDPRVVLRSYEVWYNKDNQVLLQAMAKGAGFEPKYVPTIFIGSRYWEGYTEQIAREIESVVSACLKDVCKDPGAGIVSSESAAALIAAESTPVSSTEAIQIPLIGPVDLSAQSLPISTVLIALVDGFNPCSLWVLTMLLALTLHTGSRRKVLLIGLIFLTVTAAVYALFIAGLFTMFTVIPFTGWIQGIVSLVALFFGLVNLKDYFWYKEGISFTISDSKKPGLFQRMRAVMDPDLSFWGLAGGTVVLAGGVSLVEFSCTAGFPVLWTNLLASQGVGTLPFILLLLLYLFIYQLDELAIFGAAVYSLQASRLEEKHGRILKLIGGMLMLTLAVVMLVNPRLMNDLATSLIIFGIAMVAALLVLLVHRIILPRLGVLVGNEFSKQQQPRSEKRSGRSGKK